MNFRLSDGAQSAFARFCKSPQSRHFVLWTADYSEAITVMLLLMLLVTLCSADIDIEVVPPPQLTTDAIVQNLMAANARRAAALRSYRGKRFYQLEYHGLFGSHSSEMQVEVTFTAPDKKEFHVVSQSGSKLLYNRVLLNLLNSEQEAQQEKNRQELEISPHNYSFRLEGTQHTPDGDFYILDLTPKSKSKYVYHGKIWVDTRDFAVTHMEGDPAKNPSFWVSHTEVEYRWQKIGIFWLPSRTESRTQVRMGGKANLTIDYSDYQVTSVNRGPNPRGPSPNQTMPDPSTVTADPH